MDIDAIRFAATFGGCIFGALVVGFIGGVLFSHWTKTRAPKKRD